MHGKSAAHLSAWPLAMDDHMWDVFICHASEDKEEVAKPLAEALIKAGLTVWLDVFTLRLGDNLRRSIEHGLSDSRFGVVILSNAFFSKEWPQRELDGLLALEGDRSPKILPIRHRVTWDVVKTKSPILAGRVSVSTDNGISIVVNEIIRVVRAAPRLGGNDELLITYLFKYYAKASHIAMLTIRPTNVHHFPQVGGSAQLRIGPFL